MDNVPYRVKNIVLDYLGFKCNDVMDMFYRYKMDRFRKIWMYKCLIVEWEVSKIPEGLKCLSLVIVWLNVFMLFTYHMKVMFPVVPSSV